MNEKEYIRTLAKQVRDFAESPEMEARRRLWTDHNSGVFTRPPIYIRAIPVSEYPDMRCRCEDPFLRSIEANLRFSLFYVGMRDDTIIEPFYKTAASVSHPKEGPFGLPAGFGERRPGIRCAKFSPSIIEETDIEKLYTVPYAVNREETNRQTERLQDALGDILPVAVDTQAQLCRMWMNDISTVLTYMRGMDDLLYDVYDRPEWLHRLISTMQRAILKQMDETERAGGFRSCSTQNQAMPYCRELPPPDAGARPVSQKEIWGYMASQEFEPFGPDFFEEFMFRYQKPILERYGLAAYGCCEDLSRKIGVVRKLSNLRRIAVSPFADVKLCAEQIGGDYIISYRPNPSSACSRGVDEDFVRREINRAADIFDACGCKWDVTLKDLETTSGIPDAVPHWTRVIREELDRRYS